MSHSIVSPESKAMSFYAEGHMRAGAKFFNHKFKLCGEVETVNEAAKYADLVYVMATEKSSGTMIRMKAGEDGKLIAATKNGVEDKYLETFRTVIFHQYSSDLIKGLYSFLHVTGWSLNFELVTAAITSDDGTIEACAHGSRPLTDHLIIHGGSKPNFNSLTPFDLFEMRTTIERDWGSSDGLWFPNCTLFWVNGLEKLRLLEKAFTVVNNLVFRPEVRNVAPCPLDDAVSAPMLMEGENYNFWDCGFRAEARKRGLPSYPIFDHCTHTVDNGDIFEGWVMLYISSQMLATGGMYERLKVCINEKDFNFDETKVLPLDGVNTCYTEELPIQILMGYKYELDGKKTRKLTIEEMLQYYSAGDVLNKFLYHLLAFVESPWGIMGGMKKTSFSIQLAHQEDFTGTLMTVTMKGEDQWAMYEEFWYAGDRTSIKFSRGFSILLTLDPKLEMIVVDEGSSPFGYKIDKWKMANYTIGPMIIRDFCEKLKVDSKKALSWGDRLKTLFDLEFLTRWGLISPTSRYEALKYLYLIAAYCSTRKLSSSATYLDVIDEMMAKLHSNRPITGEVILSLYAGVRGTNAAPGVEGCAMIESLADDGDALFEIAIYSLANSGDVALLAFVQDVELGFAKADGKTAGAGFMYGFLKGNVKAIHVKTQFSPLTLLVLEYNVDYFFKNSQKLEVLKVVVVCGTPGMGKTTYLSEVGRQINDKYVAKTQGDRFADHCIVMGGDTFVGKSSKERHTAMFIEILACMDSDPSINMIILDRCCGSDFGSLRTQLKDVFSSNKLLDIHILIPRHGVCAIQGNEGDWFLPFSDEQIAVNACSALVRKHNNGEMPIENIVEGVKGFGVAIDHMVAARTNVLLETLAEKELGSLAGSFKCSFFRYIQENVKIPDSILAAIKLSIGFNLSKGNKQGIEKTLGRKVEMTDGMIFKTLALALKDSEDGCLIKSLDILISDMMIGAKSDEEDIMESIWPKWLETNVKKDCEEYLSMARLPMQVTVENMMAGIMNQGTVEEDDRCGGILKVPFIPQYFGIQIYNQELVKKSLKETFFRMANAGGDHSGTFPLSHLYTKSGDIHVTSMVPNLCMAEFCVNDRDGKSILQRHLTAALDAKPYEIRVHSIVSGSTTNAALVTVDSSVLFEGEAHMTLLCAGANKDSVKEELIRVIVSGISLTIEGFYVGKMRGPSTFGLF